MQLRITPPTKTFMRSPFACWRAGAEMLQPPIIAFNISGVTGSLFAMAGMLVIAARRRLMSVPEGGN
jgi:hypothetical protein